MVRSRTIPEPAPVAEPRLRPPRQRPRRAAPVQHTRAFAAAEAAFREAYPVFALTQTLDDLRAREYARLDAQGHTYLDFTGGGLYAESQLREHLALLSGQVFGNPHSTNPTSQAATRLMDEARAAVLRFFHASPDEYAVIFTANASGALKLVGEAYPFVPGSRYLLSFDNHNSVNGIREFARAKGATVRYAPVQPPDLRLDVEELTAQLDAAQPGEHNLFAYPAQSNFSGVQHELDWIARAQARGWDVLLDAAAFVPANRLDLSAFQPDFVPISFYKMFGYPTGVGCLLARHTALAKLRRPWFAGGTITIASVQGDGYYLAAGAAGFEDGTVNYLSLPAVTIGLKHLEAVGIDLIHTRVLCLTGWLLGELTALRHRNGVPLVQLVGPADTALRGGTVSFNLCDPEGDVIDFTVVEQQANAANISLRTGCFCNPGAGEVALGFSGADLAPYFHRAEPVSVDQFVTEMKQRGKTAGAVRVSLGLVSTFADVYRCVQLLRTFLDRTPPGAPGPAHCT